MSDGNVNEATSDAELDRIIARYLAQVDAGELVDQDHFIAEYPQYAAALGEYFRDVAVVEQLANPDQGWGANTIVHNSRTTPPVESNPDEQTVVRGAADSQTSIRPDGAKPQSASIIEGEFGRYRILKTLGQGGMGAVYLAHDNQLDRRVALKIPKFEDDLADEMLERFYREARAAAMLRSPNICPVYDVGEIDGQHYITMAYIEGRPLKEFATSKKRHSAKQIAVTIRKLATGLSEAHAAGVIHRDLKPANIMIDQKNEPVVMDFGLARRNAAAEVEVTRSGAILGTPAYMSPEQVEGEQSDIGPQADVYSLGVIMYQLLTGELPFKGTLMAILKQIAVNEPQPPSALRKGLDSTIEGICLKMMAKDRAERYQSMDDVARDLSKYLKNPPKSKSSGKETTDKETADDSSRIGEESNPVLRTTPPQAKPVADVPQTKPKPARTSPKTSAPGKPPRRAAGEQRSPFNRKIVIAMAALAVCVLLYGAITLFLRVGEVDVKVVIDDPSISIHFEQGDVVRFEGSGKPIRLSPGEQKFVIKRDGLQAVTDEFQVEKDGKNILHVTLVGGKVVVSRNGEKPATLRSSLFAKVTPAGDYALKFSNLTSRVDFDFDINLSEDFTVEFWVTPTAPPTDEFPSQKIWGIPYHAGVSVWTPKGMTTSYFNSGSSFDPDVWASRSSKPEAVKFGIPAHLALVKKGSEHHDFLNGRALSSPYREPRSDHLQKLTANASRKMFLGDQRAILRINSGACFTGLIHSMRLSKGRRYSVSESFTPPAQFEKDPETLALYEIEAGSGDILKDSSGNGHHGKIVGAKWVRVDGNAAAASPSSNAPPLAVAPFDSTQANSHQQAWADHLGVPVETNNSVGMKLAIIPPGKFTMGSPASELGHTAMEEQVKVTLTKPFRLGVHEVTQGQWKAVMGTDPWKGHKYDGPEGENVAATWMSWTQAMQFCRKLTERERASGRLSVDEYYRLPTEAEWEYACRAGTTTTYSFGDDASVLGEYAWYKENATIAGRESAEHEVGLKKPNSWGLYDVHGNVREWCSDWHGPKLPGGTDPRGTLEGSHRVHRGGSSITNAKLSRSAFRDMRIPSFVYYGLGFRVVLTIDAAKLKTVTNSPRPRNDYDNIATGKWIDVFEDHLPRNDNRGEKVKFKEGVLELDNTTVSFPKIEGRNMIIRASVKNLKPDERQFVSLRGQFGKGSYSAGVSSSKGSSIVGWIDNKIHDLKTLRSDSTAIAIDSEGFFEMAFVAIDDRLSLYVNGKKRLETTDATLAEGHPGVGYANGHALFKDVQVMLLDSAQRKTTRTPPAASIAPFNEAQAKAHQKAWADYLGESVETTNSIGMTFVVIPPGKFLMGEEDNTASVTLTRPYRLGIHEVTQGQFKTVMKTEPWKDQKGAPEGENLAASNVNWIEATEFCRKLTDRERAAGRLSADSEYRLPTEAEWEYACRAGTTTTFSFGDDPASLGEFAWYDVNTKDVGETYAHAVGLKKPNGWGLFDFHGNVREWCGDWLGDKLPGGNDPVGPSASSLRAYRGGSWFYSASSCRSAVRARITPVSRYGSQGLRVALTIDMAKLKQAQTPPIDPDRERNAAEWVLSLDRPAAAQRVTTNVGTFKSPEQQLPKVDFYITGMRLADHRDQISDEGFAQLSGLSRIEGLKIHNTWIGDGACQHIAKLTTLKQLKINLTNVSDEGLAHLKRLPHLNDLTLSNSMQKVTDAGLRHLGGMTDLRYLVLSGGSISDEGLAHLVGLQNLNRLALNMTRVSDDGLLQFEKLVRLESLELRETRVTDGGLAHLKGLKKLTYVDLRDTQVTAAGVADLKKALPKCEILHGPLASANRPSPFDHLTRQDAPPTDPPLDDDIPLVAVLAGDDLRLKHWNVITQIAISADGKHLVTASADQTIKVWDAETGKLKRTLSNRKYAPGRIAISPDGKTLASVGKGDDRLWLWDIESGELRRSKSIIQDSNLGRSWMPDGSQIVMIGDPIQGKELVFVNTATLEVVERLKYQAAKAWMPVVSPDGNWLALASQIGEGADRKMVAQLWNLSKKEFVGTVPLNGSLGFTKDSRQLYAGTKAFDVETRAEVLDFSTDPPSRPLRFSPDLKLYLQRRGSGFTISGVDKARALVQLSVPSDPYKNYAAFFPDGKRVVTASQGIFGGNSVRIWSTNTGQELMSERGDIMSPLYGGLVFSSDGQTLFRTENSRVIKRDLFAAQDDGSFGPKSLIDAMRSVDVTEDGNFLAGYANYGKVWLWNLSNGSETKVSHSAGSDLGVARLAFNRASSLIAIPGESRGSLCKLPAGEEIQSFVMPDDVSNKAVSSVAFSPDGKRLAMGGVNNVIFRELDKSSETSRLHIEWRKPQHVLGMSFSPDAALLAIGSREFVEIWDVKQRHRVAELPSEAVCRSVSFSPDGTMVAWGCDDGMVRLWDVAAGKLLAEYQIGPPSGIIKQVAFTPDGRYLATANGNGSVYVLRLLAANARDAKIPPPAVTPFDEGQAKAHQKAWADYLGVPVETTNSIGMKFVVIPPGKFKMGEDDTAVDVTLTTPFRVGVHEVTQEQFKSVMKTEPWKVKSKVKEGAEIAASYLTWTDVDEFCRKLTEKERSAGQLSAGEIYRLLTEAEWEWACRAGTITAYSYGDDETQLGEYAWYEENTINVDKSYAHAVGLKKPNQWGLYDMYGNVREWCGDGYGKLLQGGADPHRPTTDSGRVRRGGCWNSKARDCRSASRTWSIQSYRDLLLGFRVVLTIDAAKLMAAQAPTADLDREVAK